jgi:hypothetical protein
MFDEELKNGAEDIDFPCRLALDGCKFGSVDEVLNYRRYHSKRTHKNIRNRKYEYDLVLKRTFNNPNCPADVKLLYNNALVKRNLNLAYVAFSQEDKELGFELLHEIKQLRPDIFSKVSNELVNFFMIRSISDFSQDHSIILKSIFIQMQPNFPSISSQGDYAIMQGFLLKGLKAGIWGNLEDGIRLCVSGKELGAQLTPNLLEIAIGQLTDIEEVLGIDAFDKANERFSKILKKLELNATLRATQGKLSANRAFKFWQAEEYAKVPPCVARAVFHNPSLIRNKGIVSIGLRSLLKLI